MLSILKPLASLRLTIVLLVLAMVLVFAGTCAQTDTGIWQVQRDYFYSFFVAIPLQDLIPRFSASPRSSFLGLVLPFPGGMTIGLLMLLNLLAAQITRFNLTWKDLALIPATALSLFLGTLIPAQGVFLLLIYFLVTSLPLVISILFLHRSKTGMFLTHYGVVLLLLGEGLAGVLKVETNMTIDEGQSVNYASDSREIELAIIDHSPADHDIVHTLPQSALKNGATLHDPRIPFDLRIDAFFLNSQLSPGADQGPVRATRGVGTSVSASPKPSFAGTDAQMADSPSAYLTLTAAGKDLGTYLVSTYPIPLFDQPQPVVIDGKTYDLQLRYRRYYKPYTLTLLKFSHDRYTGTDMPRNFSSEIQLTDPTRHENRRVLIKMNEPLRYAGETFYQASFKPGDKTTVLQVVKNPAWQFPYIACAIGGLGLLIQFLSHLLEFIRQSSPSPSTPEEGRGKGHPPSTRKSPLLPAALTATCLLLTYFSWSAMQPRPTTPFNLDAFSRLPVLFEGRVQPLDSLARNSLKILSGKETFSLDSHRQPAIQWLLDVMAKPEAAAQHPVFRIDDRDLLGMLSLDFNRKMFSLDDIRPRADEFNKQRELAEQIPEKSRSPYQRAVANLGNRLDLWLLFGNSLGSVYLIPPLSPTQQWQPLSQALQTSQATSQPNPAFNGFMESLASYRDNHPDDFNRAVGQYRGLLDASLPATMNRVSFEAAFNRLDPFLWCMTLYLLAFLLAFFAFLGLTKPLLRSAFWILIISLFIHTLGLIARIYISGRPPVTNLASSAIFIAWGAVLLAAGLEFFNRNGIGIIAAAIMGFASLLIADRLALQGDTMKVLVAVLDTNFWLATHVVVITLGYSATFLAGILAILYILRGLLTRSLDENASASLARMIYGILCFALLFSFVGTVLGGIWADQSWGRFWGWDPKENGAVLIVLWNALILHARWVRIVHHRGLALLAITGNIVTAWSWFGVNMLGVGLHSYGFMDAALLWLLIFITSQLLLIAAGSLPISLWRSPLPSQSPSPSPSLPL